MPSELAPAEGVSSNCNGAHTLNVGYCGTVASHKGPHVILDALRIARLKSVNVLLIGHAPERDYTRKLRDLAATVPGVNLKLYGKYERSELPFLLRGVDCVIMPSLVPEAGPIVPREALACGVPVLAAKLGALPEVIAEGENGFTFDPSTPQDLATILRRIASDSSVLTRLRVGARSSRSFTLAQHAEQVCAVYDRALQDFEKNSFSSQGASELHALHESLVRLGCDSSRIENHPKGG